MSQDTWPARSAMAALAQLLDCRICVVWFVDIFKPNQEPVYFESSKGKLQLCVDTVMPI